ncbi:MAG: excinuclease ABC subunit UvrA, partial [Bacteroidetes bacterium]|nr:excinuclease ABC subunit UvrA [Bacteroidota bacterium]
MTKPSAQLPAISEAEIEFINVYGARVHNLKNIDVHIPRNQLVVITGLSGSGKSSLAFDTIYAEGQRRYMESFSAYARQFMGDMERPDVDKITGLSPVISIEQKTTNRNPRSTVGTTTEIYDFLRLLFARASDAFSYNTGEQMVKFSEDQIIDHILEHFNGKKVAILSPAVRGRKGHYRELFEQIRKQGFLKVRVDGEILDITKGMMVDRYKIHDIDTVVDRLIVDLKDLQRLRKSIETALKSGNGLIFIQDLDKKNEKAYSKNLMCPTTGISYEEPSPNSFSFNSPYGSCPACKGLGKIHTVAMDKIIPDNKKSINDGGFAPLGEVRNNYTFKVIKKMAKAYDFSLSEPIETLKPEIVELILEGSKGEQFTIQVDYQDKKQSYKLDYEGIVPQILRSYNDTTSEKIRRWAEGFMSKVTCPECDGYRLKKESLHFKVLGKHIGEVTQLDIKELFEWIPKLSEELTDSKKTIAKDIIKELIDRVGFLMNVGLNYLSLDRPTRSLSGGESQRIRLATQIGSQLQGITYILDEPSIGLHQRDNHQLINALKALTDIGNTVLVVEHDMDIMMEADYLIDLGPGAGEHGGKIVAEAPPEEFITLDATTAKYLGGKINIDIPKTRRKGNGQHLTLKGATGNNLQKVDISIPLGTITCVTGVSGSGKSTLINETLYRILNQHFFRAVKNPKPYTAINGLEHLDKVIEINQSPIGRTPRSNPATYIDVFSDIRSLFANVPEAKIRGYKIGRFSFNVKGGRCEECQGGGMKLIEMNFLPNVYVECPKCMGKRYNRETLQIHYKGKSITDVLEMTIEDATTFFENVPKIHRKLKTLSDVGLGYIRLGQPSTTISGGEAQRVKLAAELSKKDTGQTIYILDEPTTGLHFEDIRILLKVLQRLVKKGNSIIFSEHNMDVIKIADHIIDLGPEGGKGGGQIVATGTPEQVAKAKNSFTGQFLKKE